MSGMEFNMLRGLCPRCGSKKRERIRVWSERGSSPEYHDFDWHTYMCKSCGLRYDE